MTLSNRPPRISFRTLGCRLNQAETAELVAQCQAQGYRGVSWGAPADAVVIHTCAVTGTAERKSLQAVRAARRLYPQSVVAAIGCAVEHWGPEALSRTGVDLVLGNREKDELPLRLAQAGLRADEKPAARVFLGSGRIPGRTRVFLKVQEGCDFGCAYCIVPRLRGSPRSRPFGDCVERLCRAVETGAREVVFTGTNLGLYRDGNRRLVDLLEVAEGLADLARVRLSSIELTTVEDEVLSFFASSCKLCRYLHLPLQSADDEVLARMGRRYRADRFRRWVEAAARRVSGLGLGTDVLVGHPGETEEAFERTMHLIRDLPFSRLHIFPYSPRPGTRSAQWSDRPSPAEVRRRRARLAELARTKNEAFARSWIGRPVSVLVETVSPAGIGSGWTSEYVLARCHGRNLCPNHTVQFIATVYDQGALWGALADPFASPSGLQTLPSRRTSLEGGSQSRTRLRPE